MVEKELSCGAVVFREGEERCYLLLLHPAGHWDFPKGHVERGESVRACAVREVKEESGIDDLVFINGFEERIHYFFRRKEVLVSKNVVFLLAKTASVKVRLSDEHDDFAWLPYEDALKQVTFKTTKRVLEKAESFLNK